MSAPAAPRIVRDRWVDAAALGCSPVPSTSWQPLVVVTAPDGSGAVLKRVAAVGGDRVGIEDGVLVVNGAAVVEPWFDQTRIDGEYFGPVSVPPDTVWVLGDNRGESVDSRRFGPVPVDSVSGRVTVRLWPSPHRF